MKSDAIKIQSVLQEYVGAAGLIDSNGLIVALNSMAKVLGLSVGDKLAKFCTVPETASSEVTKVGSAKGACVLQLWLKGHENLTTVAKDLGRKGAEGLVLLKFETPAEFSESYNSLAREFHDLSQQIDAESQKRRALEIANANLAMEALRDSKTLLLKQEGLEENLKARVSEAPQTPFAMIYLDIDNFKAINDNYGHDAGDCAIGEIGRIIRSNLRKSDIAARVGGDEFAIVLSEADTRAQIDGFVGRLQEKMNAPIPYVDPATRVSHKIVLSFSAGVARYPEDTREVSLLTNFADRAMYVAKTKSKLSYTSETLASK